MRIVILGSGAMGALFGGYLSKHNEVWMVDTNEHLVNTIQTKGVTIKEENVETIYRPKATTNTRNLKKADLIIVFVKSMHTVTALTHNSHLIGNETYIMTLQNGAGHESKLLGFVDENRVLIGTTQHNSSVISDGYINHGGCGITTIGVLGGNSEKVSYIAENFTKCGFDTTVSNEVKEQIWTKLFLNTAASSLTGILQVPLGFILEDIYACSLMESLAREAVMVAKAEGFTKFDPNKVIEDIKKVLTNSKGGYTSIYTDIKNGDKTEVDTISGSVVDIAKRLGVSVPYHEFVVALIHAFESKART